MRLLILIFSLNVWAINIPKEFLNHQEINPQFNSLSNSVSNDNQRWANKLGKGLENYQSTIEEVADEYSKERKYRLDRYDLQLGLSASGGLGVLTAGGNGALEFIWQRNLEDKHAGDDIDESEKDEEIEREIELDWSVNSKDLYKVLRHEMKRALMSRSLKPKFRERVIKQFKKDAEDITRTVRNLVLMPRVGNWYIAGFFKNYSFKTGGSIGIISFGYDLRIRFRFKIKSIPSLLIKEDLKLTKSQKKLRKLMIRFNKMSERSFRKHEQFQLKRVWGIHSLDKELDLGLVSFGAGRGVQIEYKKVPSELIDYNFSRFYSNDKLISPVAFFNNRIVSIFDNFNIVDEPNELSLHQVRIKYTGNLDVGFKVVTLGKSHTMEYHFKR